MKIHNLSQVSFGYSRVSQRLIDKQCQSFSSKAAQRSYKNASKLCNSLEDEIYKREGAYGVNAVPFELTGLYLGVKKAFLDNIINEMYDDDNGQRLIELEYKYYSDSLKKTGLSGEDKENNWRSTVIEFLREWDRDLGLSAEEIEARKKLKEKQKTGSRERPEPPVPNIQTLFSSLTSSAGTVSQNLTLMHDTPYSPKGFDDLVGAEDIKKKMEERIINPIKDPEKAKKDFLEYGRTRANSLILYGPPGCGKTFLVEALKNELNTYAFSMDVGKLGSKYINQTSVNIQEAFDSVAKIAQKDKSRPVILFLDELDALATNRSTYSNQESTKDLTTLLKCIVGARSQNILVIAATNRPDMLDEAIVDRFEMKEYIPLPTKEQRIDYFKKDLGTKAKGQKLLSDPNALEKIANLTKDYTFRSLNAITRNAADNACGRGGDIEVEDYKKAIEESSEAQIKEEKYKIHKNKKPMGFAV